MTDDVLKNFKPGDPNSPPAPPQAGGFSQSPVHSLSASASFSMAPEVLSAKMDESNNNRMGLSDLATLAPTANDEDRRVLKKAYNDCKNAAIDKFGKSAHGIFCKSRTYLDQLDCN